MQTNFVLPGGCKACISQKQLMIHAAKLIVFVFETEGTLTLGSAFKEEGEEKPTRCTQTPGTLKELFESQLKCSLKFMKMYHYCCQQSKSLTL